ncbi:MAG: hypothetical protein ACXAC2_05080 [Candidatus Kariarchaeaceae archaeon]|jgi:hypothetical protein
MISDITEKFEQHTISNDLEASDLRNLVKIIDEIGVNYSPNVDKLSFHQPWDSVQCRLLQIQGQ